MTVTGFYLWLELTARESSSLRESLAKPVSISGLVGGFGGPWDPFRRRRSVGDRSDVAIARVHAGGEAVVVGDSGEQGA